MAVENKYKIQVNTKTKMFRQIPEIVANDNVVFEIEVWDDATLFPLLPEYTYKFISKKLKGNPVIRDVSLVNGLIRVQLGTSEMTVPGKVEGTVQIFDADQKRISSAKFDYNVKKDPSMDGDLPTDELNLVIANESLLTGAIEKSDTAIADSSAALTKATTAETKAISAETTANNVKSQFDQIVADGGDSNIEVVAARGGEATLGNRLDKVMSDLAEIAQQGGTNHVHTNKSILDSLSDSNGTLQYNGQPIQGTSGGGTLSYVTLTDLQTAYPNGTTQPAWVIADNSWYYWTGAITQPADTTPPTVTASVQGGTYTSAQSITLTGSDNSGVSPTIYYSLDGGTPTTSSSVYSSPIAISSNTTLKYFAKDGSGNMSTVQTQTYTINITTPDTTAPTVTASISGGTYTSSQTVTLTGSDNSGVTPTIYYTLDGSTPTTSSTVYSSPIVISSSKVLKYFAKDTSGNTSVVQTQTYTINTPDTTAPIIIASPMTGTFSSSQTVTLSPSEEATIYYTLDGSTPTTSSSVYVSAIPITSTTTLKYFGKDTAGNSSSVQTQTYTITVLPAGVYAMDDFTRANNPTILGGSWTTLNGSFGITGNQAYCSGNGTNPVDAVAVIDTSHSDNVAIEVAIATVTNSDTRLVWRATDKENYFILQRVDSSASSIYKRVNGSWNVITTGITAIINSGSTVRVELTGATHKVYINNSLAYTFNDTHNQTATKHGIGGLATGNSRWDDFKVYAI